MCLLRKKKIQQQSIFYNILRVKSKSREKKMETKQTKIIYSQYDNPKLIYQRSYGRINNIY